MTIYCIINLDLNTKNTSVHKVKIIPHRNFINTEKYNNFICLATKAQIKKTPTSPKISLVIS